ncbi:DNA adenine methylase [Brevundimonas balnearis]|uniref:site-specific DNA-methyltransferase (adenine-specific) n=1 Tax=Brevundimonas balnearis TaxID=1572858 RepID=A0ABV6R0S5_9CAUL
MIKYIGSKRGMIDPIIAATRALLPDGGRVADLFSGSARVGHALKREGYAVWSNDVNAYAATLATALVQADLEVWGDRAERLVSELARVSPKPGWFTETFCERARFFHPSNGAVIDAVRERIAALSLEPELEAIALTSLIRAADKVDSTAGVQMAFMKRWAPRALKPMLLRPPELLPRAASGPGRATRADVLAIADQVEADLVYLDPPYNQHSYLGNYHVWESLVLWDRPETYGVANKRVDCRTRKSPFNFRGGIAPALRQVVERVRARHLMVSFSDEGFLDLDTLMDILSVRGEVKVIEVERPRYVGARIGIHDRKGVKVGEVGRLRNVERLFVVGERAADMIAA